MNANDIRKNLFKLHYLGSSYDLNKKADAFEAFDDILTHLHEWMSADCKPGKECFVHSLFCLNRAKVEVCRCGKEGNIERSEDLFAETVFVPQLQEVLKAWDEEAQKKKSYLRYSSAPAEGLKALPNTFFKALR